jgi:glycine betaine/choline ABC-type transport system substrate-binding protein
LGATLAELEGRLDEPTMQQLNYEVDGNNRSVEEVAREFLESTIWK